MPFRPTIRARGGADGSPLPLIPSPRTHQERCHNIAILLIRGGMVPSGVSFASAEDIKRSQSAETVARRKDRTNQRLSATELRGLL